MKRTILCCLHDCSNQNYHHNKGVQSCHNFRNLYLSLCLDIEADNKIEYRRHHSNDVGIYQICSEYNQVGSCNHHQNRGRSNDSRYQKCSLVEDVQHADVGVDVHGVLVVGKKVDDIENRGRHPATPLIEELGKPFWCIGKGI